MTNEITANKIHSKYYQHKRTKIRTFTNFFKIHTLNFLLLIINLKKKLKKLLTLRYLQYEGKIVNFRKNGNNRLKVTQNALTNIFLVF